MKKQGTLVVVSGFAGTGKGTVMKELLNRYDSYALSISATTRKPRGQEVDGKEYFFVMSNGKILDTLEDREWKKEE